MAGAEAAVHGAVSLVNAIATGRGATLGISLGVRATVTTGPGRGIAVAARGQSARLARMTVEEVAPAQALARTRVAVAVESEIPAGYGLKSSSAASSAVALACARIFRPKMPERQALLAGIRASKKAGVSITGAYDDVCACCYGGFNVTDNHSNRTVRRGPAPGGLSVSIFIPRRRKRGSPGRLRSLAGVFGNAWDLARAGRYWDAMNANGLAAESVLSGECGITARLLEAGALGASVSGNGPAVAAIYRGAQARPVAGVLAGLEGSVIVSRTSNAGAAVRDL